MKRSKMAANMDPAAMARMQQQVQIFYFFNFFQNKIFCKIFIYVAWKVSKKVKIFVLNNF